MFVVQSQSLLVMQMSKKKTHDSMAPCDQMTLKTFSSIIVSFLGVKVTLVNSCLALEICPRQLWIGQLRVVDLVPPICLVCVVMDGFDTHSIEPVATPATSAEEVWARL